MIKNKITTYLLLVSIFTFLAIFVFIVQQSYSNLIGPSNEIKTSDILKPINPNLDTKTLDEIQNRKYYSAESIFP